MQDYRCEFFDADLTGVSPGEYSELKTAAEKKERSELFICASYLAILLLLYNLLSIVFARVYWIFAYMYYAKGLTFDIAKIKDYFNYTNNSVTKSTAFNMTGSVVIVLLSAVTVFMVGQFIMKIKLSDMIKPQKSSVKNAVFYFPTALTLNLIAGILVNIIDSALKEDGIYLPQSDFSMYSPTGYELVIQFMYVCIVGPVCEEFIYRGLFIKLLSPFGSGLAVFFSSAAFGLMHGNVKQALPAMLSGMAYALIAMRFRSIMPTICMHVMNNIIASIGDYGRALDWSFFGKLISVINIVILFLGFYGVIVLFTDLIAKVRAEEPKCVTPLRRRFLSTGTNLFLMIYYFYLFWVLIEKIIKFN